VTCPNCQTDNQPGAKFCGECGTPLSARCSACGATHEPGQKFCHECGAPLAAAASETALAAPVPQADITELRLVSVLFVDLVGYTSLSESRDAEDVRELLGQYFERARTIVGRYGGTIEKFIGDAVMAVWGTPVAREDDADRAVRAGLELVDAVAVFGDDVRAPDLKARAGVVTGQVASVSAPGEGLVVGDRVNTASRVQSAAEPGSVWVDEITRQASSAVIAYEDAGEHTVKGKAEPLRLWRALRVVAGAAGSQREEGLEAPFVGRESELRLVKELFHAGVERQAIRLVAVSGPAGTGKTRLRWEFFKYIDGLADLVLWHSGRCLSYGEGIAYWALAEMVRQRLGIPEEASPAEVDAKLAVGLESWIKEPGEREFLTPRLGALLGAAEPGLSREELFAGWRLFFERLAEHDPVALVFEDLQWADEGLLDFIDHLLDWSADHPIFVLTFARPELAERREGWPTGRRGATLLSLEPLGEDAMRRLLDGLVDDLPSEARERVVARAEGIPLYALETVRALADRGVLEQRDGRLTPVGDVGELDVPASLSSLLAARLDALDPDERDLVKSLSVFGGGFTRSAALALHDIPEDRLDGVLGSLVRKQVLAVRADPLSPDRGQYAFAQTMLRAVAYDMLTRHERKARHLAAAEHLRRTFPNDGEDMAEAIGAHQLDAYRAAQDDLDADGLREQALAALRRAGQRAATVGAPDAAERAYLNAVELADDELRPELHEAAGAMALRAGRPGSALELFELAAGAYSAAGREREAARMARQMGASLRQLGRLEEAIDMMLKALNVLDEGLPDPDVAALSDELGTALAFAGRLEEAAAPLDRALTIAEALELHDVVARALVRKSTLFMNVGRWEEGLALIVGAAAVGERHGVGAELLRALGNRGDLYLKRDIPGAVEAIEESLVASRRVGDRPNEIINASNLMLALILAGRWDEVRPAGSNIMPEGEPLAENGELAHTRLTLLCALQGDLAAARESAARVDIMSGSEDTELRGMGQASAITLALAEGRLEDALDIGLPLLRETITTGDASGEAVRQAWPDTVDAAFALGRLDVAEELIELLGSQPRGAPPPFLRAELLRARGLLVARRGEPEAAEPLLRAAVDALAAIGYPYWLARAQTDLAGWLIEAGRAAEAPPLLDQAVPVFERLGAAPALERAQRLRVGLPTAVSAA
jgi:class 3 adenylate cyclase/tetratricopeptide (TPR) repeat protein